MGVKIMGPQEKRRGHQRPVRVAGDGREDLGWQPSSITGGCF